AVTDPAPGAAVHGREHLAPGTRRDRRNCPFRGSLAIERPASSHGLTGGCRLSGLGRPSSGRAVAQRLAQASPAAALRVLPDRGAAPRAGATAEPALAALLRPAGAHHPGPVRAGAPRDRRAARQGRGLPPSACGARLGPGGSPARADPRPPPSTSPRYLL